MLLWVSFLVGIIGCPASVAWICFICARPKTWARFTEAENNFWVRRGLPVTWAGTCKKAEQGPVMKLVVLTLLFLSGALAIAAVMLPVLHLR